MPDAGPAGGLQRLLDLDAVAQTKARYFRTMDAQDWTGFRALLADDIHFDHPTIGHHTSAEATVAAIRDRVRGVSTVHHGHNAEITVEGDHAIGLWALQSFVLVPGPDPTGVTRYARYRDELRRVSAGWVFTAIRFRYDHDPLGV